MSRKRGRDDEGSEFMPLSKRINNIHIEGNQENSPKQLESNWVNQNFVPSPNAISQDHGSSSSDGSNSNHSHYSMEYRPELNPNDNPYYYENNKLLYNLHMERMQRLENSY